MEIPGDSAHKASSFTEFQSGHHSHVRIESIQKQLSKSSKYCTHAFVFINLLHLHKIPCYLVRNEQSRVKRLRLFQPLKYNRRRTDNLPQIIQKVKEDAQKNQSQKEKKKITSTSLYRQSFGFSSSHVQTWEWDHQEGWAPKNWCLQTVVLEKTLEESLVQQGDQTSQS